MAASRVAACALPVKRTLYNTTVYAKLFTVKYRMSVKLPVPFSRTTHIHRPHTRVSATAAVRVCTKSKMACVRSPSTVSCAALRAQRCAVAPLGKHSDQLDASVFAFRIHTHARDAHAAVGVRAATVPCQRFSRYAGHFHGPHTKIHNGRPPPSPPPGIAGARSPRRAPLAHTPHTGSRTSPLRVSCFTSASHPPAMSRADVRSAWRAWCVVRGA